MEFSNIIKKLNFGLFTFLFVCYCLGQYNPSKYFIGFLLAYCAVKSLININQTNEIEKYKKLLGEKNGK